MTREKNKDRNRKNIMLIGMALVLIVLISMVFVSAYKVSYPSEGNQYSGTAPGGYRDRIDASKYCREGNDFIFQIKPLSCSPQVVRSDLLEEQDVPVYCTVSATQLNPLLDVKEIESLSFSGDYPRGVKTVGFQPKRAALGYETELDSPVMEDIGSAVIVLNREPNESAMPDYVEGNLTARMRYDVDSSFGIGRTDFYLPTMSDSEWNDNQASYSFWNGKGYLRAESVQDDNAKISIYSDRYDRRMGSDELEKIQSFSQTLDTGEKSSEIYLSGFDPCRANLQLKLRGTEDPATTARLRINSDSVELRKGEEFLDGKCRIRRIEKQGLLQNVKLNCEEDEKGFLERGDFELTYSPSIELEIDGENKTYEVGDKLYETEKTEEDDPGNVYLGYVGTESEKPLSEVKREDLFVGLYFLPDEEEKERLTRDDISRVSRLVRDLKDDSEGLGEGEKIWSDVKNILAKMKKVTGKGFKGRDLEFLAYEEKGERVKEFKGTDVSILDFGDVKNQEFAKDADESKIEKFEEYYENAMDDYDTLIEGYSEEEHETGENLGQRAMKKKISLADNTGQKVTVKELCREFDEEYPSETPPEECKSEYKFSSSEVSGKDVLIDGKIRRISFDGVYEPTYEEYGAEITVNYPEEGRVTHKLRKEQRIYLDDEGNEFIELDKVDKEKDEVEIRVRLEERGSTDEKTEYNEGRKTISSGSSESFLSNYDFILQDINQEKVAHVGLDPNIDRETSESTFNFRIEIEKRAFQMSPEKSKEKAEKINSTIETLKDITNTLDDITQVMKGACLATRLGLTAKSFIENSRGEGEARTMAMRGRGGWNEKCSEAVDKGNYSSEEECFNENSEEIDSQVDRYTEIMDNQNEDLKDLQEKHMTDKKVLGESFVNTSGFVKDYSKEVNTEISDLDEGYFRNPDNKEEEIDKEDIMQVLEGEDSWENKQYTMEELKKIEMYSQALKENPEDESAKKELFSVLKDIDVNSKNYRKTSTTAEKYGLSAKEISLVGSEDSEIEEREYKGKVVGDIEGVDFPGDIDKDTPVQIMQDKREFETYFLVLNGSIREDAYPIAKKDGDPMIYNSDGELAENVPDFIENSYFKKYDAEDYKNNYNNPELKYYETGQAKGLPAIVPFDTENGWYAAVEKSMALGDVSRGYDESGRVNSFWLCNVGENGMQEFNSGLGDDVCQKINPGTGQSLNQFPGLGKNEASGKVQEAVNAIEDASRHHDEASSEGELSIGGEKISVGSPYTGTSETRCTDFLSPKDCNILYNVCDPVLCPSSRCDFGGNYPVQDPVQSGIIGSIALCLPNFPDVKIPVCVTGLKAGMENLVSVFDSYEECLQKNAETGQTVGICDEITSVYLCDLFWKEAVPLAKYGVSTAMGQDTGGGGEYFSGGDLWQDTKETADFLTKEYSEESHKAFQQRSTKDIGVSVCKSFISGNFPSGGELLDSLTETRSPSQFSGKFEEMPMTTETNPPMSHYKVTFHIYAGKDQPANYRVYLKGEQSSYYRELGGSADLNVVDSDYVEAGGQVSRSRDITGPSGYDQLCIMVNGQEECGFEKVSTSFAVNRLKDKEIEKRVTESSVTTEEECVSGERAVSDFLNTNVQQGISEGMNPEISDKGIERVCSTQNPGQGTDGNANEEGGRWKEVGYCGDEKVKCWLDTQSVEDAIRSLDIENRTMEDLENQSQEMFVKEGDYLTKQEFEKKIEEIEEEDDSLDKIDLISEVIKKVYYNNQKAELYFERAGIYGELARKLFNELPEKEEEEEEEITGNCGENIWETAKGMINENVLRPKEGQDVPDNVCAKFVVDVLDDTGVEVEGLSPACYAVEKLYEVLEESDKFEKVSEGEWKEDLKKGDILVWSCKGSECPAGEEGGEDEFQHVTIFDGYNEEEPRIRSIHEGGSDAPVEYTNYSISSGDNDNYWKLSYALRCKGDAEDTLETGPAQVETPLFQVNILSNQGNVVSDKDLLLVYGEGQWYWSVYERTTTGGYYMTVPTTTEDKSEWMKIDIDTIENTAYMNGYYEKLDEEHKNLLQSLEGASSYEEGVNELSEGLIEGDLQIFTENTEFSADDGSYFVLNQGEGNQVYFEYTENDWYFKPADTDREVDWIAISDASIEQEGENYKIEEAGSTKYRGTLYDAEGISSLINDLEGKNFEKGAIRIFSESPSYDEEIKPYSQEKITITSIDEAISLIKSKMNSEEWDAEETAINKEVSRVISAMEDQDVITSRESEFLRRDDPHNSNNYDEDLNYIKNFLQFKKEISDYCDDIESYECFINYIDDKRGDTEKYTSFLENRIIVDYLYMHEFISPEEYKDITPTGFGTSLETVGEMLGGSPEKGKTMKYVIEVLKEKYYRSTLEGALKRTEELISESGENQICEDAQRCEEFIENLDKEKIFSMTDVPQDLEEKELGKIQDLLEEEQRAGEGNLERLCDKKVDPDDKEAFRRFLNANDLGSSENIDKFCDGSSSYLKIEIEDNRIVSLTAAEKEISDISHLSELTSLKTLRLPGNDIEDISSLEELDNLEKLDIENNCIPKNYYYPSFENNDLKVLKDGNPADHC